jgi:hypothetical protein
MRTRKRTDTQIGCYKFWAEFKERDANGLLPAVVYDLAKLEQSYWNLLVEEQAKRWAVFTETPVCKAFYAACTAQKELAESAKKGVIVTKVALDAAKETLRAAKAPYTASKSEYWKSFDEFAKSAGKEIGLHLSKQNQWAEMAADILTRYYATYKRMASTLGGGIPHVQYRLESFSLLHRYTGGGSPLSAICGKAKLFSIQLPNASVYESNTQDARRARFTSAHFGLEEESIGLNVIAHRSIPADAIVKKVALVGARPSPSLPWRIAIVITVEEKKKITPEDFNSTLTLAGIDVGWRKIGDELRIAMVFDGKNFHELRLPLKFHDKSLGEVSIDRINTVQTMRDQILERCKNRMKTEFPDLMPKGNAFHLLRNGGLIKLLRRLETESDSQCSPGLAAERKRDNDMLQRKSILLRDRWCNRRQKIYEAFALKLSHCDVLGMEDLKLNEMYACTVNDEHALKAAAERRSYAAIGTLFQAIRNVRRRSNKDTQEITAAKTSTICSKCQSDFVILNGGQFGKCTNGHEDDRDQNAARNIYASTLKNLESPQPKAKSAKSGR